MSEQLVTFETAKLAFDKGFNHIKPNVFGDSMCYTKEGELIPAHRGNAAAGYILAPTQSLLQTWLRNQKILVDAIPIHVIDVWGWKVSGVHENGYLYLKEVFSERCSTYEEALEKGLLAGLNLIE